MDFSFLRSIVIFLHLQFDYLLDWVFSWFEHRPVPEKNYFRTSNPILFESAISLARKIRKREYTSEQVVKTYIDRINSVNAVLNALVHTCLDKALEEAKEVDRKLDNGEYSEDELEEMVFLGVPFTTKESTACKGMSWTFGIYPRLNHRASEDATIITNVRDAGGILLGVSNVPQLNMWVETNNPIYGRTSNPYDLSRNVGGSSGGEAAIISVCGSPMGVGSDIGGSIRVPSFMCGIFGHKCSPNLTCTKGMTYRDGTLTDTMVVAGPMCRYAEDLAPLLKVICGNTVNQLQLDTPVDVKKLKYYYVSDNGDLMCSPLRAETKEKFKSVINHFDEITDTKCKELNLEGFKYSRKLYKYWLSQEGQYNFKRDLTNRQGEVSLPLEIIKFLLRKEPNTLASLFVIMNSDILPSVDSTWAKEVTKKLKDELLNHLGSDGVLLFPSAPFPARRHSSTYLQIYNFLYFAIFNVLKVPVTQVPLGLGSEGLPHGIQVVAGPYNDHLCLAVAKDLEATFGGHRPPFYTENK